MSMQTVALYNFKGGSFKSTGTVNIATGLAIKGYRVLVIDTDPQAHATQMLGLAAEPCLYNLLARPESTKLTDVLRVADKALYTPEGRTVTGDVVVISSNEESRLIPMQMRDPLLLMNNLRKLSSAFDVALIDTAPTPSLMLTVIQLAIDAVLYPTKCEALHIDGLTHAMAWTESLRSLRETSNLGAAKILGILPAIYRSATLEHAEQRQHLIDAYGDLVWKPVPDRIIWAEAARMMQPVFTYAPNSSAAKDGWKLVDEFEKRAIA